MPALIVRIDRLDGGLLVLDGGELAKVFFTTDPSSRGAGSYDSLAGHTAPNRINIKDLEALNRGMRARTSHRHWKTIMRRHLPWLEEIRSDLDLIQCNDTQWTAASGERLVRKAFTFGMGKGRGASVVTKLLHLKRPRLFPVLDRLVVEMIGGRISYGPLDGRVKEAVQLVSHFRIQARRNLDVLLQIQQRLADQDLHRSLVRILDVILWSSHPNSSIGRTRRFNVACLSDRR